MFFINDLFFVSCSNKKNQQSFDSFTLNQIIKNCDSTLDFKIKHDFIKDNDSVIRIDHFEKIISQKKDDTICIDFGLSTRYKNGLKVKIINERLYPEFKFNVDIKNNEFDVEKSFFENFLIECDTLNQIHTTFHIRGKYIIPNYDKNKTEITFNDCFVIQKKKSL